MPEDPTVVANAKKSGAGNFRRCAQTIQHNTMVLVYALFADDTPDGQPAELFSFVIALSYHGRSNMPQSRITFRLFLLRLAVDLSCLTGWMDPTGVVLRRCDGIEGGGPLGYRGQAGSSIVRLGAYCTVNFQSAKRGERCGGERRMRSSWEKVDEAAAATTRLLFLYLMLLPAAVDDVGITTARPKTS